MREILFRGKCNGVWVYGGYTVFGNRQHVIYKYGKYGENNAYEVNDDTVGQYTGVYDKNGTRIFEGDIVRYGDTTHEVVFETRFENAYFGIVMNEIETWGFSASVPARQMEVIGNKWDGVKEK